MAIIEIENLAKVYPDGTPALQNFNLKIEPGEMVGILGHSGAGKTTLFRLLNGSIRPSGGSLAVLNHRLEKSTTRKELRILRREIALIYQNHNIIPPLSVMQNVLLGRLGRVSTFHSLRSLVYVSEGERQLAAKALQQVGLAEKLYSVSDELSGGQQQRVALARAVVQQARLLLADEPVASVDVKTAGQILALFSRLNYERGVTVLMNLHQVEFARQYCRRVLVLKKGGLVYDGKPEGLNNREIYSEEDEDFSTGVKTLENKFVGALPPSIMTPFLIPRDFKVPFKPE